MLRPAGVLPAVSGELGASLTAAGQFATVFAGARAAVRTDTKSLPSRAPGTPASSYSTVV
jgi:hypothetical protein